MRIKGVNMCARQYLRTSSWKAAFIIVAGFSTGTVSASSDAFSAPADKSLVHVLQGSTGQYASLSVSVNGRILENTSANTSFAFVAPPGRYDISTAASGRGNLVLTTKAGETYYVYVQVNAQGAPVLRELDDKAGTVQLARHRALRDQPVLVKGSLRRPAAAATAAAPARRAAGSSAAGASSHSLIIKPGMFKLSSTSQSFLGSSQDFDSKSKSVFAVEYEYRFSPGFAVGAEIGKYSNSYTRPGLGGGSMDVLHFDVKAKKYFEANAWLHPFVGGGIASAVTDFSGPITGGTLGVGLVAVGGAEFRFGKVGVYTELRYFSCKTSGEEEGTNADVKVNVGGTGLNVGAIFHF
jgi:hypothetical protein